MFGIRSTKSQFQSQKKVEEKAIHPVEKWDRALFREVG